MSIIRKLFYNINPKFDNLINDITLCVTYFGMLTISIRLAACIKRLTMIDMEIYIASLI